MKNIDKIINQDDMDLLIPCALRYINNTYEEGKVSNSITHLDKYLTKIHPYASLRSKRFIENDYEFLCPALIKYIEKRNVKKSENGMDQEGIDLAYRLALKYALPRSTYITLDAYTWTENLANYLSRDAIIKSIDDIDKNVEKLEKYGWMATGYDIYWRWRQVKDILLERLWKMSNLNQFM